MKSNKMHSLFLVLITAALLAACSAASPDKKTQLENLKSDAAKLNQQIQKLQSEISAESGPDPVKTKDVAIVSLKQGKFDHYVQTQGSIESIENIQVSSKTAGIVTQVFVVEGEVVSRGQILGQVDNSLIQRGIEELKSSLELANTVFERQKNLWDQKIGTEVQYLQAKNNRENLERRLASMNEQNDMTRIKSPINGIVDEVTLRVGQNIAPGMPAARVVNNQDLKVKANVSEAYVSQIKKGNRAIVTIADLKKDINATVSFVGRNINALSRSFVVEVRLPSSADLRPNMSTVLRIVFESSNNALVVPVNVVQDINGTKVVYTADTSGKIAVAHRNVVEVVGVYDNKAEIKSGLKPGDQVITVGYQGLNDGELIKI
jgi:membrane fusion protein (multidrug efflux system)